MRQTIILKLEPTPAQFKVLQDTLEAFNRGCQLVADIAYEKRTANKIALQPLVYADLRRDFGLSSQMVVRCISKACEAYKLDKRVHVKFEPHDSMILDQRLLSIKSLTTVSILCISGRQLIPFRFEQYSGARSDRAKGQADLTLEQGAFFLHVIIDLPTAPPVGPSGPQLSEVAPMVVAPLARRSRVVREISEEVDTVRSVRRMFSMRAVEWS